VIECQKSVKKLVKGKDKGIIISCDLNYRKNIWSPEKAQEAMTHLLPYIDLLIGNEEDAELSLGLKPSDNDINKGKLNYSSYEHIANEIIQKFGTKLVAFTLRTSISASDNRWAGMIYDGTNVYYSKTYDIHLVDRVGGGDSFAAGLVYSFYNNFDHQKAIEFAVAASCLKQTIEQDFNLSTVNEVLDLM